MTDRIPRPLPPYNPNREFREETGVLVFHDVPEDEWLSRPEQMKHGLNAWMDSLSGLDKRSQELHRMPYEDYLRTPEWNRLRRLVLYRAEFRCERCGRADQEWNVHHLTYERRGYEELTDLVLWCRACHRDHHGITGDDEGHSH